MQEVKAIVQHAFNEIIVQKLKIFIMKNETIEHENIDDEIDEKELCELD